MQATRWLLAVLVASTISATVHNGSVEEARMRKADQYAQAAGLDLAALWAPGVETFGRIRKGGLLAILREECGNEAAENCSKLKGGAGPRHWRASAAWLVAHPMLPLPPKVEEQAGEDGDVEDEMHAEAA
jgi:ParB family chromosome partitioning protein